jgi:cell division protein FtsQ
LEGGILTQDLVCLKAAIEELAWVHTAAVRRVWPDRLVISVLEHEPLARWGEARLVTAAGTVFRPGPEELPDGLPRFDGPDDQAPLVTRRFTAWAPRFRRRGLSIVALELDARGAWRLRTDADFSVALGTGQTEERVDRFLSAYPYIVEAGLPARVDVRYSNGLAVSWRDARLGAEAPPGAADAASRAEGREEGQGGAAGPVRLTRLHREPEAEGAGEGLLGASGGHRRRSS